MKNFQISGIISGLLFGSAVSLCVSGLLVSCDMTTKEESEERVIDKKWETSYASNLEDDPERIFFAIETDSICIHNYNSDTLQSVFIDKKAWTKENILYFENNGSKKIGVLEGNFEKQASSPYLIISDNRTLTLDMDIDINGNTLWPKGTVLKSSSWRE